MAQLKDSVVSGNLRVSDTTLSGTVQLTTLRAPTTAGGTTYGPGTNGQVLKTNGTSSYWGVVDKIGSSTVGGTYLPIYLNAGTPTAITVKNNTAKSAIGWASGAAANASLVTLNSIAYWNGCYSGTSSNLEYCAKGAFGTIVTKSTTDYSKVSISRDLTSGTKIGTITIDGTSTDLYCQTNTNTDTKVTQTATSTSDFRPIVLGYTHSTTPGDLAPSTAPTDQVYVTTKLYMQPTSGDMYSAGAIILTTSARGLKLTDSDGNAYAGIWDNGYNLWIGATQATTTHHVGQTFISSGYDSANSTGYDTIRISVPNATNDGATNYYALHDGNTSASASIASTATGVYQIGTVTIRNTTTTLYGVNTNTWTAMVGATSSANGTAGYVGVNPPKDGYNTKFWRADGSWAVPTNTTYGLSGAYGGTGNSTWVTTLTAGGSGTTSTVPTASTDFYGITKLSTATNSTSTSLAATASAVKAAYDLADGKSVVTASTSTVSGATTIKSIKINNTNYNIYDSGNTDTKVNVKLATTTKAYLLATSTTPTSSDQAVTSLADTGVYLSTTAGEIVATNFSGKINNHTVGADVPATAVFTDEKVKQTATSTSDFRPVVFGTTHSTTPGDLAPSTAPVDQVYVTPSFYMQPSTGKLYAKSKIYFDNATFDTSTTPTTVTTEAAGLYAYDETGYRYQLIIENTHNLWIGAGQTNGQHHTGETYISAGYDKANSVGFSTIKISVPNATNDGATNYSVWHSGNLTPYTHPTYTAKSSGLYKITVDGTGHVSATAAVAKGDIPALDYLPLTGGTVTGDVTLKSTSGNSPQLIFQRGTLIDNLNDWKIYVKGGGLYFAQSTANASSETWTDKMYFHPSDGKLYVGTKSVLTEHPTITTDTDTTSTASPAHGGTFTTVDSVTRDTNGHVTKINVKTVTLPASGNTDTKVTQSILATSVTDKYPLLVSYYKTGSTTTTAQTANRVDAVYVQPSTGTITATNFVGTVNSYSIGASVPSAAVFTDENVTQTELSLDASYEVLFAGTADSTTHTEGVGKSSAVTLNPSSGNLTTTGAFVLKEGSYTGTITQNTLTANRTWTFPKHASGIVHIEQRANFYDDTASVASTPWQKVASLTTGAASTDRTATFIVAANYSGDVDKKFGIVQCHLRTNGSKVFSSAELTWLYKSPQLFLSDIVLLYKSVADTSTTIEIWAKSNRRYSGYTFTLLDEHDRKGVISGQWELTTNNGAAGSASLPSGFTSKDSRILSDGTLLATETYSGSDNTHTITNTDYDWDSFSLILLHIKTGTTSGLGDNYITIPIPWKDFNDYFDSQTTYNNNGYIPYGLSQYSSGIFLMGNHHQGFSIALGTGSWVSSKTIKVIGIV